MKIVSLVYFYVQLRRLDDWLSWENPAEEEMFLNENEIRHLNSDFNYKHYGQFYEKLEAEQGEDEVPEGVILSEEEKE
jgi:hypothetical protein